MARNPNVPSDDFDVTGGLAGFAPSWLRKGRRKPEEA